MGGSGTISPIADKTTGLSPLCLLEEAGWSLLMTIQMNGIDQIIVPGVGDWVVTSRSGEGVGLESSRAHPQDEVDRLRR